MSVRDEDRNRGRVRGKGWRAFRFQPKGERGHKIAEIGGKGEGGHHERSISASIPTQSGDEQRK